MATMRITHPPAPVLSKAPKKALDRRARIDRRGIISHTPSVRSAISAVENGLSGVKHKGMGEVEVTHRAHPQRERSSRETASHLLQGAPNRRRLSNRPAR